MLAAKCLALGLELTCAALSKIEAQLRCVSDSELLTLAKALKVELKELYPGGGGEGRCSIPPGRTPAVSTGPLNNDSQQAG